MSGSSRVLIQLLALLGVACSAISGGIVSSSHTRVRTTVSTSPGADGQTRNVPCASIECLLGKDINEQADAILRRMSISTKATYNTPSSTGTGSDVVTVVQDILARDNVTKLHTYITFPSAQARAGQVKSNVVLIRTPYGAQNFKTECLSYVTNMSLICMSQDMRGRGSSTGDWNFWRSSGTDAYDTMEWASKQQWFKEFFFTTGTSANSIAAYTDAAQSPPWLRAQLQIVGSPEMYKTTYQGGAFRNSLIKGWLDVILEPEYVSVVAQNEVYTPTFWDPVDIVEEGGYKNVKWPSFHVTGWYDIFNQQTIEAFHGYNTQAAEPGLANLLILPSGHCRGGQNPWPAKDIALGAAFTKIGSTALIKQANQGLLGPLPNVSTIYYYVMGPGFPGTSGNYWASGDSLPTYSNYTLYLQELNSLSTTPATAANTANYTYAYNPANPVVSVGGNNLILKPCGPWDQRQVENRTDVLTFTSPPLTSDLYIAGPLRAVLFVSSDAVDTDFTAKITDVQPDGTSYLLQDGIFRMRWRTSRVTPSPMINGTVYEIEIDIWQTAYIFTKGNRIRLDVSSSNFPRFAPNPNTGALMNSTSSQTVVANNNVHISDIYPSRVILPQVNPSDMKAVNMEFDIMKLRNFAGP